MMNEGANKGILVATSHYGPDAYEFSKDNYKLKERMAISVTRRRH